MVPRSRRTLRSRRALDLDGVDLAILRILSADARTPNSVVASAVGIAPSTCSMRVRRLHDIGVIRGYRADLDAELLGSDVQALICVRLQAHARTRISEFSSRFIGLPGVLNVFFVAGADDFLLHVCSRSTDALREFVVTHLSEQREIATTRTSLVFEHRSAGSSPLLGS